jgi:hypothetical protein
LRDPISKKPVQKKGWWSDSRCSPLVQAPVPPKKKKKSLNTVEMRGKFSNFLKINLSSNIKIGAERI